MEDVKFETEEKRLSKENAFILLKRLIIGIGVILSVGIVAFMILFCFILVL